MPQTTIQNLLRDLPWSGFTVSITVSGGTFKDLKVVGFENVTNNNLVLLVDNSGVVNAFRIDQIERVNF